MYNTCVWAYKILLRGSCFDLESNIVLCVIGDFKITKCLLFQLKLKPELVGSNSDERSCSHDEEDCVEVEWGMN